MNNIYNPGSSYLCHYASPYYDPVKAHEYYMEHRQLKGRTTSLNDTGKAAAKYVKNQLTEEKKRKIQEHKETTDRGINNIKGATNNRIKTLRESSKSDVSKISEQAKSDRKKLSEDTKKEIEQHKTKMQLDIESLRNELSRMTKTRRLLEKDRYAKKIAKLREDNAAKRAELSSALKSSKQAVTDKAKSDSASTRSKYNDSISNVRDVQKSGVKEQRDAHTQYKNDITEEYNKKYEAELDKISSDSSMQKTKSTKSGSKKKKSGRVMK